MVITLWKRLYSETLPLTLEVLKGLANPGIKGDTTCGKSA
jgi:hypothetical protein